MDLGTAPLFLLAAPTAAEAEERAGSAGSTAAQPVESSRADALLIEIRDRRAIIADQEIGTVRAIAEWAAHHTVVEEADASTITERGLDTGLPLAGEGAPLISDFAVMHLAAVLGRSLDSGRSYVGQVVELAYRLPHTWGRVLAGRVPVWKALRIAESTRMLPADAAGFVDRQLAPVAHGCTWAQVDRLVEAALVRFDPPPPKRSNEPPKRPGTSTSTPPTSGTPAPPPSPRPSTFPPRWTSRPPSPAARS